RIQAENRDEHHRPHAAYVTLSPVFRVLIAIALLAAGGPSFRFVDVAKESGVTLLNIAGTRSKSYLIDSTGNGAAFLDYDRDGRMDILIVNGSSLARFKNGGDQIVA